MTDSTSGRLIMFDGPDGVGKTTQIDLASDELRSKGQDVYVTRIHGGTPYGEALRKVTLSPIERSPLSDHFVFMAMHTEHRLDIAPRLARGQDVLMDRSPLSDWAYQICASGLDSEVARQNIQHSMKLFNPDIVICYTAGLEVLKQRMRDRGDDAKQFYFKSKPESYHVAVIRGYAKATELFGAYAINADGTAEAIHSETMQAIHTILPEHIR